MRRRNSLALGCFWIASEQTHCQVQWIRILSTSLEALVCRMVGLKSTFPSVPPTQQVQHQGPNMTTAAHVAQILCFASQIPSFPGLSTDLTVEHYPAIQTPIVYFKVFINGMGKIHNILFVKI